MPPLGDGHEMSVDRSSILTTGWKPVSAYPLTIGMAIADHQRLSPTVLRQILSDHSNWSVTGGQLVADQNECDCNIFGGPMVADGLWWSATSLTLSVTGLLGSGTHLLSEMDSVDRLLTL